MATTTPYFGWPIPTGTDADDVPYWMNQLAVAIENSIKAPPMARATQTSAQTLTTAVYTSLLFNAEDYDTASLHSTVTNTNRLTASKAGYWRISTGMVFATSATGIRKAYFNKNANTVLANVSGVAVSGSAHSETMTATVYLNAGDYVEVVAYQNSGGNLAMDASTGSTWFEMIWVGA